MSPFTRKTAGTTLVEILVVIVVFAVGLLAVAQIFPRGIAILTLNRAAAMATFQCQDLMQQLYSHPETLPDEIVPILADTGAADPNFVSTNLSFEGVGISSTGIATMPDGSTTDTLGNPINWEEITGFNVVRGIIGETQSIPAPTLVGPSNASQFYGGLVVLQFGPTSMPTTSTGVSTSVQTNTGVAPAGPISSNLIVYGNDFTRNLGPPNPSATVSDFEFYYDPYTTPELLNLLVPTAAFPRQYLVSFSGYVAQGTGNPIKKAYQFISPIIPATVPGTQATLETLTLNSAAWVNTDNVTSIDFQSIRVQPIFNQLPNTQATWSGNPFEVRILNPQLGTFLFSPFGYNYTITRPSGPREALKARFNYAVKDWRILREDFRIDGSTPSTHQLPIQSLRTNATANVDGTPAAPTGNGFGFESLPADGDGIDHFVLIDMQTGGTFYATYNGQPLITLDKSRGIITFNSLAGSSSLQGELYLPDGTSETVNLANRPVRALYQARYDWAVQVLKAASSYNVSQLAPGVGQYYIGNSSPTIGGLPTRLYFPRCDTGRKVVIGQIWYDTAASTQPLSLTAQDFVIHPAGGSGDTTGLPFVDITDVDPNAQTLDQNTYGYCARDVKGSSLMVRVIWNPNVFALTANGNGALTAAQVNAQAEAKWSQSYRVSASETYLDQGVISR